MEQMPICSPRTCIWQSQFRDAHIQFDARLDELTSFPLPFRDRILCFELAAKRGAGWVLKYVKSARGVTDGEIV